MGAAGDLRANQRGFSVKDTGVHPLETLTTIIVMGVTGRTAQWIIEREAKKRDE